MPLHQAIAIFIVSLALAAVATTFVGHLRSKLLRPITYLVVMAGGGAASAVSALVARIRHAGTGVTTSYGWPKPFYFRYLGETGERSDGWSLVYFLGNSLIYMSAVLILWTVWSLGRR